MDILQAAVEALRSFTVVRKIILFGSRARGDHKPKSDFDIAIDCPEAGPKEWINMVQAVQAIPTLLSIQMIRYDSSSFELQARIQEEGVLLYERQKD